VGLGWSYDSEGYVGDRIATARVTMPDISEVMIKTNIDILVLQVRG
jgi:hypothetical protein